SRRRVYHSISPVHTLQCDVFYKHLSLPQQGEPLSGSSTCQQLRLDNDRAVEILVPAVIQRYGRQAVDRCTRNEYSSNPMVDDPIWYSLNAVRNDRRD